MRPLTPIGVCLLFVAALIGCTDQDEVTTPTGTPAPTASPIPPTVPVVTTAPVSTVAPSPTPSPVATAVPVELAANVYWAWSINTVPAGTPERLGAGTRVVEAGIPLQSVLAALLVGPDEIEREIGMSSEIPVGTKVLGVAISPDNVATVDLSGEFEEPSGTLGETFRIAQVVFTATQFPSVDRVRFQIDGVPRDAIGSHGLDVSNGVGRNDFGDIRPAIMVEAPYPGATVVNGFSLRGESSTFEATVEWILTDADGLIVADGFTTATAGNGTWGSYETTVAIPAELTGRGAVLVFETSARDGSPTNVVEYPVMIGG